jgi:hypothetical protein
MASRAISSLRRRLKAACSGCPALDLQGSEFTAFLAIVSPTVGQVWRPAVDPFASSEMPSGAGPGSQGRIGVTLEERGERDRGFQLGQWCAGAVMRAVAEVSDLWWSG